MSGMEPNARSLTEDTVLDTTIHEPSMTQAGRQG